MRVNNSNKQTMPNNRITNRPVRRATRVHQSHIDHAAGVINPFQNGAYPLPTLDPEWDTETTYPASKEAIFPITSDSFGFAYAAFCPTANGKGVLCTNTYVDFASQGVFTPDLTSVDIQPATSLFSTADWSCIRSAGVEFIPVLPADAEGGFVLSTVVGPRDTVESTWDVEDIHSGRDDFVSLKQPFTYIDTANHLPLVSPGNAELTNSSDGTHGDALLLRFIGPASRKLGYLRVIIHFEIGANMTNSFNGSTRPLPHLPATGALVKHAKRVHAKKLLKVPASKVHRPIKDHVKKSAWYLLEKAGEKALSYATGAAAAYFTENPYYASIAQQSSYALMDRYVPDVD